MNSKKHLERAEALLRQSEDARVSADNREAARKAAGVHAVLSIARELQYVSEWIELNGLITAGVAAGVVVPGLPVKKAS